MYVLKVFKKLINQIQHLLKIIMHLHLLILKVQLHLILYIKHIGNQMI